MIKELLVSTALLCSASLSFSYCMGEARIVVERKIVKSTNRPHRAPEPAFARTTAPRHLGEVESSGMCEYKFHGLDEERLKRFA